MPILLITKGILYGVIMAFMIGPVFFTLIRISIEKDFSSGVMLASGIAISEGIIIGISYMSVSWLAESLIFQTMMGIAGGAVMVAFGVVSFFRNVEVNAEPSTQTVSRSIQGFRYVSEGFFLNILNPFVYLFWIGLISADVLKNDYDSMQASILFSGTVITIFLTDTLKAYIADKISHYLTPRILININKTVGVVLLGFGLRLLYFGMFGI